ncbi:MAG TPA: formimidoylglutamate deiminase [Pyrinomonadaceae bacterium]|jgi:formimidoylglutamate deiminase
MTNDRDDMPPTTAFIPDLLYDGVRFRRGRALVCDAAGRVASVARADGLPEGVEAVRLAGRALLPGMVNAHSHAFQRVIRGRTERRGARASDSFWTWREEMYAAAGRLAPEDVYDASRMAFMEMALGGVTSVGEFHYLHRAPDGSEYDDPNLLAREVVRAARDVGLRIALLRVAYARAGFGKEPDPRQRRFIEPDPETYLRHADALARDLAARAGGGGGAPAAAWAGVAPHSVRAVAVGYLREVGAFARERGLPLHMHVAEQPAEVEACLAETGRTPVMLLADEGLLAPNFTGVHAVHVTPPEVARLAAAGACVCACPTTERNLGDGVVPADALLGAGVPVALGTDSHAQIDLLEDARELEYHLRLTTLRRNVLAPSAGDEDGAGGGRAGDSGGRGADDSGGRATSALAARLFECATGAGARSIGADAGSFEPGRAADFFTVDLDDPSVAGACAEDLLPAIVFSLTRAAVRDTAVGGRLVVESGRHAAQSEIVSRFAALQRKLWGGTRDEGLSADD